MSTVKEMFLSGGGKMGALMRAKDWSKTSVGDVSTWPQSLRTTLSILLSSKFPMFLFWGPELICFYNDAYRPSLGNDGKHPYILGMPGEDAWPEIWHIIKPLIDQVLTGEEATWSENQLIPIYRNGKIEDVYWTFSYSPVNDENGVAGVFVTCSETTEQVMALKKIENSEKNFRNLINESPFPACIVRGNDFVIELANEQSLKLWGKDASVIGKKVIDAIPELKDQPFIKILEQVYSTGEIYEGKEELVYLETNGDLKPCYINFIFKALRNEDGNITGILSTGFDVTEQVKSRKKLEDLEERSRLAIDSGLLGTFDVNVITGELISSERLYNIFGFNSNDATRQDFLSLFYPEDLIVRAKAYEEALETGSLNFEARITKPTDAATHWIRVQGKYIFDEDHKPVRLIGIIGDITGQKNFTAKIEETEKKFRNSVMQAPVGIAILKGTDFVFEMANHAYLMLVDKSENELVNFKLFDALPETKEIVEPLLTEVLQTGNIFHATELEVFLNRFGKKEPAYFNLVYQPIRDDDGKVNKIMVVATEVTEQVKLKHSLLESEKQFRNLVMQSPIPMTIFRGEDHVIEIANNVMVKDIWRKDPSELIGKKALEVFPELNDQKYPALLKKVLHEGVYHREYESIAYVQGSDGMRKFYLDYEYAPLSEPDGTISGVMITVNDVTERAEAREKLKEAEERTRLAAEASQLATWDLDLITDNIIYSPKLATVLGYDESAVLTHKDMLKNIYPDDLHSIIDKAFETALQTGLYSYEARVIYADKSVHWIRTRGKVYYDEKNNPVRLLGTMMDITSSKEDEEKIAKFAAIVHSSNDAIISKKLDTTITSWNDAAQRIFGYSAEEMIGESILKLIPPKRFDEEKIILSKLRKGEMIDTLETQRITKDNKLIDVSLTVSPLRNNKGEVVGASKIVRDITNQKLSERLLRESEQKFRLLADSMPQFVWTGDVNGNLNYFSQSVYDYSGLTAAEVNTNGWIQIVHPDDREENISQWLHSIKTGEPFLFEHRFRRYDGEYRWQLSRAVPQKDDKGQIQMWVGTSTDIDDIKKHEQQKDDFIKMASHELKTPVTTVKGYVQLLLKMHGDGKDAFLSSTLSTIDKQVAKLTKLITDLLDLTKIETGSLYLNNEKFYLADAVKEIVTDLQTATPTHHIVLHQYADKMVYGDRDRITQVINNLITNAIKYSPNAKKIIVEIKESAKKIIVSVQDFGIGIATQEQDKIFERFYRVAGKDEKTYPGFGIGLFIVKEIVSKHKGSVWVESEKDKGTKFYISLPVVS